MTDLTQATERFGDYRLLKMLTKGSIAEIILALKADKLGCKKYFIIKKLFDHIATNEDKLQAFVRECEIATSLSHENIVQGNTYGSLEIDGIKHYYLAMDYVFGKNLSQVIKKTGTSPIPIDIVCSVIYSTARGLIHAHSYSNPITLQDQPIVHKDISPDNIIISYRGEIKITDFGISLMGDQQSHPGKIAGKWSYMSPEQKRGVFVDRRSDIFSLGVVFWECLTGEKLFTSSDDQVENPKIPQEELIHPSDKNDKVPREVGDICMMCLGISPKNRYQSAQQLRNALIRCRHTGQFSSLRMKRYLLSIFAEEFMEESRALRDTLKELSINTPAPLEDKPDPSSTPVADPSNSQPLNIETETQATSVTEPPQISPQKFQPNAPPAPVTYSPQIPSLTVKPETPATVVSSQAMVPATVRPSTFAGPPSLYAEKTMTNMDRIPKNITPTQLNSTLAPEVPRNILEQTAQFGTGGLNLPQQYQSNSKPVSPAPPNIQQRSNLNALVCSKEVTMTDHEATAVVASIASHPHQNYLSSPDNVRIKI